MKGYTQAFAINELIDKTIEGFSSTPSNEPNESPEFIKLTKLNYLRTIQTHLASWRDVILQDKS